MLTRERICMRTELEAFLALEAPFLLPSVRRLNARTFERGLLKAIDRLQPTDPAARLHPQPTPPPAGAPLAPPRRGGRRRRGGVPRPRGGFPRRARLAPGKGNPPAVSRRAPGGS